MCDKIGIMVRSDSNNLQHSKALALPLLYSVSMRKGKAMGERGFTLIEMLVVVATIGILAGISLQSFSELRNRGFQVQASSLLNGAKVALNAGKVGGQLDSTTFYWAWTQDSGDVEAFDGSDIAPGFKNMEGFMTSLWIDMGCDSGEWGDFCATDGGFIGDCAHGIGTGYTAWRDGTFVTWAWNGAPWC